MLIRELANATNTSRDTIRHYDQLGLLQRHERPAGSRLYADYPEDNIERIEFIRMGKIMGFTLREIGSLLNAYYSGTLSTEQQVVLLRERQQLIRSRIAELKEAQAYIQQKMDLLLAHGQCASDQQEFAQLREQANVRFGRVENSS